MASQGAGSPYRQELPHRAKVEVALWTAPRFAGRLGALSLIAVGVIAGASPTFVALRCRREEGVRSCSLVEHRALWAQTRPLDVSQVDGVAPSDSPGFTLLDTERALARVPRARQLPLPRRALYQISEDEWRDDASLETWANDFFGRMEPARILVRHRELRHGIPSFPPGGRRDRWKFRSGERFAVLQPIRGVAARASPWISLALPLSALVWLILAERSARRFALVVDPAIGRVRGESRGIVGAAVGREVQRVESPSMSVREGPGARPWLAVAMGERDASGLIEGGARVHAKDLTRLIAHTESALTQGVSICQRPSAWRRFAPSVALALAAVTVGSAALTQRALAPQTTGTVRVHAGEVRCDIEGGISLLPGGTVAWRSPAGLSQRTVYLTEQDGSTFPVRTVLAVVPGAEIRLECDALRWFRGGCVRVSPSDIGECRSEVIPVPPADGPLIVEPD